MGRLTAVVRFVLGCIAVAAASVGTTILFLLGALPPVDGRPYIAAALLAYAVAVPLIVTHRRSRPFWLGFVLGAIPIWWCILAWVAAIAPR